MIDLYLSFQFSFRFLETIVFFKGYGEMGEKWKEIIVVFEKRSQEKRLQVFK